MSIWTAFGFVALGMLIAHAYNWMAWRKFYEGRREYYERMEERRNNRK